MLRQSVISRTRAALLAAAAAILLVGCSRDPAASDPPARDPAPSGDWARWKAYGDEMSYLNTRYVSEGPPVVAETLDIWRPEPAFTYLIKDRRAFWCKEQEVALLERWVSKNGRAFEKREISADRARRRSIREFDVHSSTIAAPPNQIAILHATVCNRRFGEKVADPLADFEKTSGAGRHRSK